MAEPITLEEAKTHLRVDTNADDSLIEGLIAAARNHCENELGLTITDGGLTVGEVVHPLPASVRSAMLIMLGFLYESRDSDAKEIPGAVAALLDLSPLRQRLGAA